jgi:type I restriction enzyme S subunit
MVLRSPIVFEQFSMVSRGGTMDVINIGTLNEIMLALPPLSEQKGILAFLTKEAAKLDDLASAADRAIGLLKERRSSLIAAAVTGQIDVRSVTSELVPEGQEAIAA